MANERGTSFPIAGVAVAALLLSSTVLLTQRGFESLRQSEIDAGKRVELSLPPVEARLWEDPLQALRRHNDKMNDLCFDKDGVRRLQRERYCDDEPIELRNLDLSQGHWTVVASMLPGAAIVGNGEARRRARYAVLAGLGAAGYVPDYSERIGVSSWCPSTDGCKKGNADERDKEKNRGPHGQPTVLASAGGNPPSSQQSAPNEGKHAGQPDFVKVPYETLSAVPVAGIEPGTQPERALVLWIDDSVLGKQWLAMLASLLEDVQRQGVMRLRVIGPADSKQLATALEDLGKLEPGSLTKPRWDVLAGLRLISPNSTAPDKQILKAAHHTSPPELEKDNCAVTSGLVEEAFNERLEEIRVALRKDNDKSKWTAEKEYKGPFFVRTIGTDDQLADQLVEELFSRGLDQRAAARTRRLALISEWDSIYARTFAETLRAKLECKSGSQKDKIKILSYHYLRGLDGSTVSGDPATARRTTDGLRAAESGRDISKAQNGERATLPLEWPEGGSQRDYLRRLVRQLGDAHWWHRETEVLAIGIIGQDVHDKLLIAQALRETFQDRTIFTTDLDARLSHPAVTQYTHNLVVASSLPLVLPDNLQCGVPPFRDNYQTAIFLAARMAAGHEGQDDTTRSGCSTLSANSVKTGVADLLKKHYMFEVARDHEVELVPANASPEKALPEHEARSRPIYALLAGGVFLLLGVVMVWGKPGPAMMAARYGLLPSGPGSVAAIVKQDGSVVHVGRSSFVVAGLEAAALGFAAGVTIELSVPGSVGPAGAVLLALAAAVSFWTFVYPGTPWLRDFRARRAGHWEQFGLQVLAFVVLMGALWWALVIQGAPTPDAREPFDAFNGASAWPSQLLRTLGIVLFAWFLDFAWCATESAADDLGMRYFSFDCNTQTDEAASEQPSNRWHRFRDRCCDATIWLWRPYAGSPRKDHSIDGIGLWQDYRRLLRGRPRLARVTLWLGIAAGLAILVSELIGGLRSENPTRGIADRELVEITLYVSGFAVFVLLVLVADAAVLTWRFVMMLKAGRSCYPSQSLSRFAAELGPMQPGDLATEVPPKRATAKRPKEPAVSETIQALAIQPTAALPADRGTAGGGNTLLDDWIDARLLAELTAVIGRLIIFPFVLVALIIVARSPLFDNWQMGPSIFALLGAFTLGTLAMAALLNWGAERARRKAVQNMEADLLWLKGAGPRYAKLAELFPILIDQVKTMRQGAFAPFLEQPTVKALMVPLGGAGGMQLLQYTLLGPNP